MSHELFEDFVSAPVAIRSRKARTMPISIGIHAVLVAVIMMIPILGADVLPPMPVMLAFVAPAPAPDTPSPPPEPPPARPAVRPVSPAKPALSARPEAAPVSAPSGVSPESGIVLDPEPASPSGVEGGLPGGTGGTIVSGLPAPPPPPSPPAAPSAPMRLWSGVKPPTKTTDVPPVYPYIAQAAKVSGTVIIEAVVGPDGRVTDAHILRSIPLLDRAALDAVARWVYTPTLFNGVPVSIIMTVTVSFRLE